MNHSEPIDSPFPDEGAALRIGPFAPGEAEDEYHVYFHPGETARTLFVSRTMEPEPLRLTVRLILCGAAPGRDVLAALRLLEVSEDREEIPRGFRLVLIPGGDDPEPLSLEAPPVQFLLCPERELATRHFIIRVNVKYAEEEHKNIQ